MAHPRVEKNLDRLLKYGNFHVTGSPAQTGHHRPDFLHRISLVPLWAGLGRLLPCAKPARCRQLIGKGFRI